MTTSRYDVSNPLSLTNPDGRVVRYLRRRFLPDVESVPFVRQVRVRPGDRGDIVAARELDDPELAWFLADANGVRYPSALAEPGRLVRVPLLRFGGGGLAL